MSSAPPQALPKHGPYPPANAGLGGQPTKALDDAITSVFLVLFILGAATHMTIFQLNRRRGRKFVLSAMTFGFCMARITASTMRLVWASHPRNISVAIASQIFIAAGVIILFIINLVFTQRLIRSTHPHIGWTPWFSWAFKLYYASIIFVIIMLITAVVQGFYVRSPTILKRDHDITLFGSTYFAVAAFLPILFLAIKAVLPTHVPREDFGSGSYRSKVIIVLFNSTLLTLGAAFRAGTAYVPRPAANPAWYHSKPAFYLFDLTIEIIIVYFLAIVRVDKRFIVPNGSHGPGDYSRSVETGHEEKDVGTSEASTAPGTAVADLESGLAGESRLAGEKTEDTAPSDAVPDQRVV